MSSVYLFLHEGFEEIEALTPVDLLRRGGVEVKTVGVTGKTITGSHGVPVVADIDASGGFALPEDAAMVVLPGGPGTGEMKKNEIVRAAVREAAARDLWLAAICAAPTLLCELGLLAGKASTAFPGCKEEMAGCGYTGAALEIDGKTITSRSAGTALRFARALLAALKGQAAADAVIESIYPEAI